MHHGTPEYRMASPEKTRKFDTRINIGPRIEENDNFSGDGPRIVDCDFGRAPPPDGAIDGEIPEP